MLAFSCHVAGTDVQRPRTAFEFTPHEKISFETKLLLSRTKRKSAPSVFRDSSAPEMKEFSVEKQLQMTGVEVWRCGGVELETESV